MTKYCGHKLRPVYFTSKIKNGKEILEAWCRGCAEDCFEYHVNALGETVFSLKGKSNFSEISEQEFRRRAGYPYA